MQTACVRPVRSKPGRPVCQAAQRIRSYILLLSDGKLPQTVLGWENICVRLGVPVSALYNGPHAFTARLFYDERLYDGWLISYNARHSEKQIMRYICHEIAEFIAVTNNPSLFDDLPKRVYNYSGGDCPDDARHRVAKRVEEICFRR